MKPAKATRLRWLIAVAIVAGALSACWLGFQRLRANETTGLKFVGTVPDVEASRARLSLLSYEDYKLRGRDEWLPTVAEPTPGEISQVPDREFYRFYYQPSFNPQVIVSAWKDGEHYWIRTNVIQWDFARMARVRWESTRPLSLQKWNRLRALFQKPSVVDPLDGRTGLLRLDGTTWSLESVVHGKATHIEISNPVRVTGYARLQWIGAEAGVEDFVETGRLMLDWGKVTVPEMR